MTTKAENALQAQVDQAMAWLRDHDAELAQAWNKGGNVRRQVAGLMAVLAVAKALVRLIDRKAVRDECA